MSVVGNFWRRGPRPAARSARHRQTGCGKTGGHFQEMLCSTALCARGVTPPRSCSPAITRRCSRPRAAIQFFPRSRGSTRPGLLFLVVLRWEEEVDKTPERVDRSRPSDMLCYCTRCGGGVEPYRANEATLRMDYGFDDYSTPLPASEVEEQGYQTYDCPHCGVRWVAYSFSNTGYIDA